MTTLGQLMADDIVLWTAFVTGIVGTIVATASFVWQLVQWRRGRTERSITTLNNSVLKPWSETQVAHVAGWPDGIDMVVPRNAFPQDVSPKIPEEGMLASKLTGFYEAEMYLMQDARHPDTWNAWIDADRALTAYNNARRERHKLVETMVAEGMTVAFPNLAPAIQDYPQQPGTYSLANAITVVERISYQHAAYNNLQVGVTKSLTTIQGQTLCILSERNSLPIIIGIPESQIDEEKLNSLLLRWITDDRVRQLNVKMVNARAVLEKALEEFRTGLREVCLSIDRSGG